MAKRTAKQTLQLGDYVKILHSGYPQARIVELRGPLGPGGMKIYRVRVGSAKARRPTYIELREDQLEPVATHD